jgi:hypothetical protein
MTGTSSQTRILFWIPSPKQAEWGSFFLDSLVNSGPPLNSFEITIQYRRSDLKATRLRETKSTAILRPTIHRRDIKIWQKIRRWSEFLRLKNLLFAKVETEVDLTQRKIWNSDARNYKDLVSVSELKSQRTIRSELSSIDWDFSGKPAKLSCERPQVPDTIHNQTRNRNESRVFKIVWVGCIHTYKPLLRPHVLP